MAKGRTTFAATQREKTMETPEQRSARRKANAEYYKALGRCPVCGKKDARTETAGGWCFDCLERERRKRAPHKEERNRKRSESGKRLYNARKAAGLCPKCGRPNDTQKATCSTCRAKGRERAKQARIDAGTPTGRWNNGLCGHCVKKTVVEGYKLCEDCLKRIRSINHKPPGENHPWRKIKI